MSYVTYMYIQIFHRSNAKIKRLIVNGKDCNSDVNYPELLKENRLLTNKVS